MKVTPIQQALGTWFLFQTREAQKDELIGMKQFAVSLSIGLQIGKTNPELAALLLAESVDGDKNTQKLIDTGVSLLEMIVSHSI